MLVASAAFLLYTAVIVPVQLCIWTYEDPCEKFPTLYFDVVVDTFFLVIVSQAKFIRQRNEPGRLAQLADLAAWPRCHPPTLNRMACCVLASRCLSPSLP